MKLPVSMKNFFKHWSKRTNWFLLLIFALAALVRFYNFPNRVTFWSEQARSLIVSANYLKIPSLLGQPYFIREDTNSHVLYAGAAFNYSMIPLLLVSGYDPIIITVFFAFLNVFTGLMIYLLVKRIFNKNVATISCALFLFNDWMIYHSLFIWSYNFLPLIGILILYFGWLYLKKRKALSIFLLGLFSGLVVSLQFLFLPIALAIFVVGVLLSKRKIIDSLTFVLGMIFGNLPMVIFDLRHNFYESRTLIQYFIDTLAGKSNAAIAYYYFLPFWPIFAITGALILVRFWRKSRPLTALVVILYLFLNLTSIRINWKAPTGMPEGITTRDVENASRAVAEDVKGDFNVAEVLDFDKQAYVLRYFLQFKNNRNSQGIADYPNAKVLYVLSEKGYNFVTSSVWEVKSAGLTKISKLSDVGNGYAIYKLEK